MPTPSVRIATVAKPGFRARVRSAKPKSRPPSCQKRVPRASRTSSLTRSTPPNVNTLLRRAGSARLELLGLHRGVELELFGELALVAGVEDDGPQPLDQVRQDAHGRPPSVASRAPRTQSTRPAARAQAAAALARCLRAGAVPS